MPNFPGKVHMYTNSAEPSEFYVGQSVIYDMDYPTIFTSKDANGILRDKYKSDLTVNGIYQEDFKKVKILMKLSKCNILIFTTLCLMILSKKQIRSQWLTL